MHIFPPVTAEGFDGSHHRGLPNADSIDTGTLVESIRVRVVSLSTAEISEITRLKRNRSSGSHISLIVNLSLEYCLL